MTTYWVLSAFISSLRHSLINFTVNTKKNFKLLCTQRYHQEWDSSLKTKR